MRNLNKKTEAMFRKQRYEIFQMKLANPSLSLAAIGKRFGLSRQRVSQIIKEEEARILRVSQLRTSEEKE